MKSFLEDVSDYFKKLDKFLLLAVVLCSATGVVLLNALANHGAVTKATYITQLGSMIAGVVISLLISIIDYKKIARLWFLYVPAALIPVALTFTSLGIGVEGTDDVAWLKLGPVTFQPSEVLKIAFLLSFSFHLYKVKDNINNLLNVFLLCLHGAAPILIVMKQGDHGTALVFIVMFLVMLFSAGISIGYIIIALLAIPPMFYLGWTYLLGDVQKDRIMILFNPGSDPEGIEYQQDIGLSALAAGGKLGQGLDSKDFADVPEIYNDFIFSYAGYVFGFAGCIAIIALAAFICIKLIADSRMTREELGKNICVGAFAMIFTHYVMNIGMVLKVMPVIGIPFPFMSAGGTALLSMYIIIGIVLSTSVHSERKYRMFELEKEY